MRVAVSGAHRTGKTSLVEELCAKLPNYSYEQEPYHLMEDAGHVFPEIPTADDFVLQLEYSVGQIIDSGKNVIFDRSPFDMLAYLAATDDRRIVDLGSQFEKVEEVMARIDLIVLVPVEDPDVIGCAESELPELRTRVDEILKDSIFDLDIDAMEVRGSLVERRDEVLERMAPKM